MVPEPALTDQEPISNVECLRALAQERPDHVIDPDERLRIAMAQQ